ncbi:hypothetical protein AB0F72_32865 [Actinoplanes sp. NPDC023936]|uniref:hypothetical protein n=1 Tax=Actinoplanes sp. NPDC023936 TaxID=3154910 RepID=UPI00340D9862
MGSAEATAAGVCFRCGGSVTADQGSCRYCGMPVVPELAGAPAPAAVPPPPVAPPSPMPEVAFGAPPPPSRRPLVIAIAAALVVLLAGTAVIAGTRLLADTPQAVVGDYFDALADGDADRALKLVNRISELDTARYPLISDAGLSDPAVRPKDVTVGESTEADIPYGRDAQIVDVHYRAGDTEVDHQILVVRPDEGEDYQVLAPFVALELTGVQGRAVTVNGVELTEAALAEPVAFPGWLTAEVAGNALFSGATATGVPAPAGQGVYVTALDFGEPVLATGASEKIESTVRETIDRCAATSVAQTAGCPFALNVWGQDATVRWTVVTYPKISVAPAQAGWLGGGTGATISDDGTGKVRWSAKYTDFSGTERTESGEAAYRITGIAEASSTGIQVTLA